MSKWTTEELEKIGNAEELQIMTRLKDDRFRKPVTIWVVRLESSLFVRSVNGRDGAWFRSAMIHHEGRIKTGGLEKDVKFIEVYDPELNDKISEAYLTKYGHYPQYVAPMVTA